MVATVVMRLHRLGVTMDLTSVMVVVLVFAVRMQVCVHRRRRIDGQRQTHRQDQDEPNHQGPMLGDKGAGVKFHRHG